MQRRRPPDLLSLLFGLGFLAVAITAMVGRIDALAEGRWVWPAVLVIVGSIMLLTAARRHSSRPPSDGSADQR